MNEEYLWSRNGSDAEIENLEHLLREFRFDPIKGPGLEMAPDQEPSWFSIKRFGWVFGFATPTFTLALFGFWLFSSSPPADVTVRNLHNSRGSTATPTIAHEMPTRISTVGNERKSAARNRKSVPSNVKTIYRSRKPKADRIGSLVAARLTKEEKYAYDRLILALSIAGTKLKVVQDAVDGNSGKDIIRNTK